MDSGSGGGRGEAIRDVYYFPIASCLQGTILGFLAPTPARIPTAGSVASGH
jgi:hypothetical protein